MKKIHIVEKRATVYNAESDNGKFVDSHEYSILIHKDFTLSEGLHSLSLEDLDLIHKIIGHFLEEEGGAQ